MYVAVKGGEAAIANAHKLLADRRRGDRAVPALRIDQIVQQLGLAVDRAMGEGSLYDQELAALAIMQARGDLIEAIFLVRAYRTTLPRFGYSEPIDTGEMRIERRISATFKDLPGGQVLGPTFDYTHRLLDPSLIEGLADEPETAPSSDEETPRVTDLLTNEGLIEPDSEPQASGEIGDLTREPLQFPLDRGLRLQALARGDEGFLLSLGYSTQRGYARSHPFVGEIRIGEVEVELDVPELGFAVSLGRIKVTECQMVNQFKGSATVPPQFTRGYGLVFGQAERKAMSMSLVDRALRAREFGEDQRGIAQDEEFVISHCDNVQATGFVEHLKLPHYVDFQAELDMIRRMRGEFEQVNTDLSDTLPLAGRDGEGGTPRSEQAVPPSVPAAVSTAVAVGVRRDPAAAVAAVAARVAGDEEQDDERGDDNADAEPEILSGHRNRAPEPMSSGTEDNLR